MFPDKTRVSSLRPAVIELNSNGLQFQNELRLV